MKIRRCYLLLVFLFSALYFPMPSTLIAQYPSCFEDYYIVGNPDSLENVVNKLQSNKEQYLHGLIGLELSRFLYSNKFGQGIETISKLAHDNRSELGQVMYQYLKSLSLIESDKTAAAQYLLQAKESFEIRKDTVGETMCWYRLLSINYSLNWVSFGDSLTQKKCYENIVNLGAASTSPYAKLLLYRTVLLYKKNLYGVFDLRSDEDMYNNAIKIIDEYPRLEYLRNPFIEAIGISYFHAKDYVKLLELHLEVYNRGKNIAINNRVIEAYNVGNAYFLLKDLNNAKKYFQTGVTLWKEHSATNKQTLKNFYEELAEIEFIQKHYYEAWDYRSKCDSLDEVMHKTAISSSLVEAQTKYETLKKEAENNKLQVQIDNSNRHISGLIVGVIVGSALSLLIVFLYRKTQNRNVELKRLNELTEVQNKELSIANKRLERFTHTLSHDALGYINHILNYATAGQEAEDVQEGHSTALQIHRYATNLKKMAQNLIQLNEMGLMAHPETVVLRELVVEVSQDMDDDLRTNNVTLNNLTAEMVVKTNRELLKQVLRNLTHNAVKFRRSDVPTVLDIKAVEKGNWVEVSVADNGIGIAPEQWHLVFNEFTKLGKQTEGSGLGLFISKQIVAQLGGQIWVESTIEQGSTFYFTLPKMENTPPQ